MTKWSIFFCVIFSLVCSSARSFKINKINQEHKCDDGPFPPKNDPEVPTEVIDLDVSPGDRYNDLASKKAKELSYLLNYIRNFTSFMFDGKLFEFIDKDLVPLVYTLPSPYKEEIVGLSKASGLKLGDVLLYNIFYEATSLCTSIVAENKEGKLFHARNLDFGTLFGWDNKTDTWGLSEALRPLVVNLDYRRKGKTVYKTVSFAGYVGVLTGMKPGRFSITVNSRLFSLNGGLIGIIEWVMGKRTDSWTTLLTRDVLERANSFSEAHDMLANTEVLAPVYYILGGNQSGEGVVITRDRAKRLKENRLDPANGKWFVLETNYDFWKTPSVIDDRRTPGKFCMSKVGQSNIGPKGLYNVLSSQPVLNKSTTYTVVIQVSSGEFMSYVRNCRTPCFPW